MKKRLLTLLLIAGLFAACSNAAATSSQGVPLIESASSFVSSATEEPPPSPPAKSTAIPLQNDYIASVADAVATQFTAGDPPPEEQVRAAYRYLIETVYFADPVGLDIWRYRGDPTQKPSYVENRAISPLLYGVGSCEDFAAALTVLLGRMGYPAQYVSGLTISNKGEFVDHAWTVVQIDENWYHLDPQLEQNVIRDNQLTYRYFLKDDQTMLADHRWGSNLAAYWNGAITSEQKTYILQALTPPPCPTSFTPVPAPEAVTLPKRPDGARILKEIAQEQEAYRQTNEPLTPVELDITPPILKLMPKHIP